MQALVRRAKGVAVVVGLVMVLMVLNGTPAYADSYPYGNDGQCTYGAWTFFHAYWGHGPGGFEGDAYTWRSSALAAGIPVGTDPRVGSIVVFQRGVRGASAYYGHVGFVVKRYSSTSFRVKEMNSPRWGVTSYRDVTTAAGVSFIYHTTLMDVMTPTAALVDSGSGVKGLFVKVGVLAQHWQLVATDATKFQLEGGRVASISKYGELQIATTDQNLFNGGDPESLSLADDVRDVRLDGDRIAALTSAGDLLVKQGSIDATWTTQASGVQKFDLFNDRIGYIDASGRLWCKEGDLSAPWTQQHASVQDFELDGDRIAALTSSGDLLVKQGSIDATWTTQASGVQKFDLAGERVGYVDGSGQMWFKLGPLSGKWRLQSLTGVSALQLEPAVMPTSGVDPVDLSRATVYTPVAPSTMYHTRSYTVYAYLKPRHTAGSYPVRIYKYRYVSGSWRSYGYVKAKASNYSSYTKCSVSVKLPYTGKWKVRAYAPADSGHSATWSSGYDYVTVK